MPSTTVTQMTTAARAMHTYLRHQVAITGRHIQAPGSDSQHQLLETITMLRQYTQQEDTTLEAVLREWDPVKANELEDHSLQLEARLTRIEQRAREWRQQVPQTPEHATLRLEWDDLCATCERHWQHKTEHLIPWIDERIRTFSTLAKLHSHETPNLSDRSMGELV